MPGPSPCTKIIVYQCLRTYDYKAYEGILTYNYLLRYQKISQVLYINVTA